MKKIFSILILLIFSGLIMIGCLPREEIKKDLSQLKLDLDSAGLPDQVFSQISCLTAAYNFYENTDLTNQEFIEKFGFDLSDVDTWKYDQGIPWEEFEQKLDFDFKYVNYMSDYSDLTTGERSREELLTKNIDAGNIMMLKLDSYLGDYAWSQIWDSNVGDYVWTQTVKYRAHAFWIIWYKYEKFDSYPYLKPYFISPIFPEVHSFEDFFNSDELQYVTTNEMVIISKKE